MDDSLQKRLAKEHQPHVIREQLSKPPKAEYVSNAVLGGVDGCVTTFAVVSSCVGAGLPSSVGLIMGIANLIADGFSMAASSYEAIKAENDFRDRIRAMEEMHIDRVPEGEREEIRQIFERKGFTGNLLDHVVDTICADRGLWVETMLVEEHGIRVEKSNAMISSLTTFGAFLVVGAVPLLPFLATSMDQQQQFMLSAILAALMFFSIGAAKGVAFGKSLLKSGMLTLMTGGAAAALAFGAGYLLRNIFGIEGM